MPPFSPSAPFWQLFIIYQHNYPLPQFLPYPLCDSRYPHSVTASMVDSFDTWEHVAHDGSHTWSDYPGWNDDWASERDQHHVSLKLLAEILLSHDANVQAAAGDGFTALHMAAAQANATLAGLYHCSRCACRRRHNAGQTALHYACACPRGIGH